MKTTVELPDELVREVKAVASETGASMRELIIEGLYRELGRRRQRDRDAIDFVFPSFDGGDGLIDGLDLQQAIYDSYGDRA